jgi:hypothetical protein
LEIASAKVGHDPSTLKNQYLIPTMEPDYLSDGRIGTLANKTFQLSKRARHSFSKCMECNQPPTHECIWADGRGRAWFCDKHWKAFNIKTNDIVKHHEVDGCVNKKYNKAMLLSKRALEPITPSPNIVIEPYEPAIQKAVDKIKSMDGSLFNNVTKIVVHPGSGGGQLGHVEMGEGKDPREIHIFKDRIIQLVKQQSGEEGLEEATEKAFLEVLTHEIGHIGRTRTQEQILQQPFYGEPEAERQSKEFMGKLSCRTFPLSKQARRIGIEAEYVWIFANGKVFTDKNVENERELSADHQFLAAKNNLQYNYKTPRGFVTFLANGDVEVQTYGESFWEMPTRVQDRIERAFGIKPGQYKVMPIVSTPRGFSGKLAQLSKRSYTRRDPRLSGQVKDTFDLGTFIKDYASELIARSPYGWYEHINWNNDIDKIVDRFIHLQYERDDEEMTFVEFYAEIDKDKLTNALSKVKTYVLNSEYSRTETPTRHKDALTEQDRADEAKQTREENEKTYKKQRLEFANNYTTPKKEDYSEDDQEEYWGDDPSDFPKLGDSYKYQLFLTGRAQSNFSLKMFTDQNKTDVQKGFGNKPGFGIWTSTIYEDNGLTSAWIDWAEMNAPDWIGPKGAVFKVRDNAKVYHILSEKDYQKLVDLFPPVYGTRGVDWIAVSNYFDGVHADAEAARMVLDWDMESTVWLNPRALQPVNMVSAKGDGSEFRFTPHKPIQEQDAWTPGSTPSDRPFETMIEGYEPWFSDIGSNPMGIMSIPAGIGGGGR